MYHDQNWNAVQGDELAGFLEQINPIDGKYHVNAESTQVQTPNSLFTMRLKFESVEKPQR